jgi:hypothetical protein
MSAERVVIFAFHTDTDTSLQAQEVVMRLLDGAIERSEGALISWWPAEDERADNSDNDSAVFVHKGNQKKAHALLERAKLTGIWNRRKYKSA